jgi:Icc-related predicted phosphoesterase
MRIAALYDIHGNFPALNAVLEDLARNGADRIVIGGDVLPRPMPKETLERLRSLKSPVDFIIGNGELAVLAEVDGKDLVCRRSTATVFDGMRHSFSQATMR